MILAITLALSDGRSLTACVGNDGEETVYVSDWSKPLGHERVEPTPEQTFTARCILHGAMDGHAYSQNPPVPCGGECADCGAEPPKDRILASGICAECEVCAVHSATPPRATHRLDTGELVCQECSETLASPSAFPRSISTCLSRRCLCQHGQRP